MSARGPAGNPLFHLLLLGLLFAGLVGAGTADEIAPPPVSFGAADYQAREDQGRLIVTATLAVQSDTAQWTPLPIAGLTLIRATLDGRGAIVAHEPDAPHLRVLPGRRRLVIEGSLPLVSEAEGRAAAWTPQLNGTLRAPGLAVSGAAPIGNAWLCTAGAPLQLTASSLAAGGERGTWQSRCRAVFTMQPGRDAVTVTLNYSALGKPASDLFLTLPAGFALTGMQGAAERIGDDSGVLRLRPTANRGEIRLQAEAALAAAAFELAGLAVQPAARAAIHLELAPAAPCEISIRDCAGLVAEDSGYRVVAPDWRLAGEARSGRGVETLASAIENFSLTTTLLEDERQFNQLDLVMAGWLPQSLPIRLPLGNELVSATVNGRTVAPTRADDAVLVPLDHRQRCEVRLVYRGRIPANGLGYRFCAEPPRLGLPTQRAEWNVLIPDGMMLFALGGRRWQSVPRLTPFRLIDLVTGIAWALPGLMFAVILHWTIPVLVAGLLLLLLYRLRRFRLIRHLAVGAAVGLFIIGVVGLIFIVGGLCLSGDSYQAWFGIAGENRTTGRNQAALSGGPNDGGSIHSAFSADHRRGATSITVDIPLQGVRHGFSRTDLESGEALPLLLIGRWPVRLGALGLILVVFWLSLRRPPTAPLVLLLAAAAEEFIPGAFLATLAGVGGGLIFIRLRNRFRPVIAEVK